MNVAYASVYAPTVAEKGRVRMAKAFKKAIEAGREAREIGLAEKLGAAAATSPLTGFLS